MSGFEYIDLDSNRVRVTYGVHGRVVRIIPAAHKGLRNRQAYLPTDPAQRLAMAEAIVGGPLIEVGDLPEVERLERTAVGWRGDMRSPNIPRVARNAVEARVSALELLALARAIEACEKADAEAETAEDAKVERVADALTRRAMGMPLSLVQGQARVGWLNQARAAIAALDADQ